MPTALGVLLLTFASATALPVARWGDSALVLMLIPAALIGYLAGRRMLRLAPAVITFAVVLVLALPASYALPDGAPVGDWMAAVLLALLTVVLPWWWGRYRLLRAQLRASDAIVLAERAQAEERARIADDLHDTIGHELALIAVQAGALEVGPDLQPRQAVQFRELREAAVRASAHLREVVQLADQGGPARLEPAGGDLDALVDGARGAGMSVETDIERGAIDRVHPLIADLAVRAVREGLTNAARHAGGSAVQVRVASADAGGMVTTVGSDAAPLSGRAASASTGTRGSGHGIASLRRRAELLGAALAAGPGEDGGFLLELRAPASPQPAAATTTADDPELESNARAAHRSMLRTALVPVGVVAVGFVVFLVAQAMTSSQTALSSTTYARLELGMTQTELVHLLPAGISRPAPTVDEPAAPLGADCDYYEARDGWLHFTDAAYRLCFRDGVLVEKLRLEDS